MAVKRRPGTDYGEDLRARSSTGRIFDWGAESCGTSLVAPQVAGLIAATMLAHGLSPLAARERLAGAAPLFLQPGARVLPFVA